MNRSTKSLLRAAVFASAATAVAMAGAPAHADTGTGPLAVIFNGPLKSLAGGHGLLAPPADLTHPTSALPGSPAQSADGLATMAKGLAGVSRTKSGGEQARAAIGRGSVLAGDALPASPAQRVALLQRLAKGLPVALPGGQGARAMLFSGATATCVSSTNGPIGGTSIIDGGKLLGAAGGILRSLPVHPPANYRVPTGDPSLGITLNKQIKDLTGTTVSAISLDDKTGALPDRALGVVHCAPLAGPLSGRRAAQRRQADTVTGLLGQVTPQVQQLLGGLPGAAPALRGAVPQAGMPNLPVDPAGTIGMAKDALPAGLGDTQAPELPATTLNDVSRVFGGLRGLPIGNLPATSLAGKLPVG